MWFDALQWPFDFDFDGRDPAGHESGIDWLSENFVIEC